MYVSPRCRSHAPRGGALLRRSRRSRRPVARSFHASGRDISRSGATSFCPRRQKDAKTPPKTHGLWNSFTPNVIRRKKAYKESPPLLSPLPLPRTARVACYDRLRDSAIRAAAAPVFRAAVRRLIGGVLACRSTKYASQQRVFFIFRGPTGRTCTYRRWRHVRDLIIAKIGRTTRPILLCRSGSDKRIASDSLYDDQRRFGFRVVRGGRFPAYSSRAGSLETCGFKQTFWSLLGLWPKVTRARGRGTLSCRCWKKWGRRRQG